MEPLNFIIEYRSRTCPTPVFLIWYPGEKDQLLTFKTGEIFATDSAAGIQKSILAHMDELNAYDGMNGPIEAERAVFDMDDSHQALCDENYSPAVLKQLTDFINLFGDYVSQDQANDHLYSVWRNRHLCEASEYFYNEVFMPGNEETEVKPLVIDKTGLVEALTTMTQKFEARIRVIPD